MQSQEIFKKEEKEEGPMLSTQAIRTEWHLQCDKKKWESINVWNKECNYQSISYF